MNRRAFLGAVAGAAIAPKVPAEPELTSEMADFFFLVFLPALRDTINARCTVLPGNGFRAISPVSGSDLETPAES